MNRTNPVYEAECYVLHAFMSTIERRGIKNAACTFMTVYERVASASILLKCDRLADRLFRSWPGDQVINVIQRRNDSWNDSK